MVLSLRLIYLGKGTHWSLALALLLGYPRDVLVGRCPWAEVGTNDTADWQVFSWVAHAVVTGVDLKLG